ncbi:hypothetical protein BCR37DRAFT_375751 [Protomyces lactucae-debilis]|uniref:Spo12 family-domain-containing protein n=1 Tax=Protomyces lactucae-debilis TaxID=2754530 RepID=A0A1Y2FXD7_PROLT|nr:uncharacterized protein BCR37DRAFT_375751 [Protomyces lactucae-debilis]ORY87846.1 hypothetical protein BCR37DRAFT_375751 [Protomyces lactucae-debilis]
MSTPFQSIDANTAEIPVQPLHPVGKQQTTAATQSGPKSNLEHQRDLLRQKLAAGESQTTASPTDMLMSPCTAKLQANKNVHYKRAKPLSLQSRFSMASQPGEANKENK